MNTISKTVESMVDYAIRHCRDTMAGQGLLWEPTSPEFWKKVTERIIVQLDDEERQLAREIFGRLTADPSVRKTLCVLALAETIERYPGYWLQCQYRDAAQDE